MTKTLLIKTTPHKIFKLKSIIKKEENLLIISLTKYIRWKLEQKNIKSRLFEALAKTKDIESLHDLLSKKYAHLCVASKQQQKLNYPDLFKNHLCWEVQNAYYFIDTLEKWLKKYRVKKIYCEDLPLVRKKRYAKDINHLMRKYYADKKITLKKI